MESKTDDALKARFLAVRKGNLQSIHRQAAERTAGI
jgi:hypothetical protein